MILVARIMPVCKRKSWELGAARKPGEVPLDCSLCWTHPHRAGLYGVDGHNQKLVARTWWWSISLNLHILLR